MGTGNVGLPNPILAMERDDLALAEFEADLIKHDLAAEGIAQAADTKKHLPSFQYRESGGLWFR